MRFFFKLLCIFSLAAAVSAQDVPLEVMLPGRPVVTLVSGEDLYSSATTLPEFKEYLERYYPVECRYLRHESKTHLPGLEVLDETDVLVLYVRRNTLPEAQLDLIRSYLESGRPLVALRTSSHAFENWKSFDQEVLAGNYQGHYANDQYPAIRVSEDQQYHPILTRFRPFVSSGSLYRNNPLPQGAVVLLNGKIEEQPEEPVAWVHTYHGARIFYTSLGHPDDFKLEPFKNLLVNALFWGMKHPTAPVPVEEGAPKRVDVEEFDQVRTSHDAIVLDVRTPGEFSSGHIPGAINVDFSSPDFTEKVKALDKKQVYLLHCRSGGRSQRASTLLEGLGFTRVFDLAPGILGWEKEGKPMDK